MNIDTVNRTARATDSSLPKPSAAERQAGEPAAEAVAALPHSTAQAAAEQQAQLQRVQSAAAQIESYLKDSGRALEFRVDEGTGRLVVTVRDSQTGETIRQIPSEEALELARSLGQGGNHGALVKLSV